MLLAPKYGSSVLVSFRFGNDSCLFFSITVYEHKYRNSIEVLLIFDNQNLFASQGHLMYTAQSLASKLGVLHYTVVDYFLNTCRPSCAHFCLILIASQYFFFLSVLMKRMH